MMNDKDDGAGLDSAVDLNKEWVASLIATRTELESAKFDMWELMKRHVRDAADKRLPAGTPYEVRRRLPQQETPDGPIIEFLGACYSPQMRWFVGNSWKCFDGSVENAKWVPDLQVWIVGRYFAGSH